MSPHGHSAACGAVKTQAPGSVLLAFLDIPSASMAMVAFGTPSGRPANNPWTNPCLLAVAGLGEGEAGKGEGDDDPHGPGSSPMRETARRPGPPSAAMSLSMPAGSTLSNNARKATSSTTGRESIRRLNM